MSKESDKLKRKLEQYRKLKGSRRLTREEKEALLIHTPSQVFKARKVSERLLNRRKNALKKLIGKDISGEDLIELKYSTPGEVAKSHYGILPKKKEKQEEKEQTYEEKYPDVFTSVKLPIIRWWDIPAAIRNDRIERKKGGFLYENSHLLWETPERISLTRVANEAVDGKRMTKLSFLRGVLPVVASNSIFVDPMGESKLFFVYANEWDKVDELPNDYTETRRYEARKR